MSARRRPARRTCRTCCSATARCSPHAGIRYPADRFDAHFLAALDLMRMPWGGLEAEAIGAWDRLAEEVRAHRHTSIISHEILATASRSQVGRALTSLGHDDGTEIHIVLSVRDLVRQIPAEWQENVKHRSGIAYQALPRPDPRPRAGEPDRHLVLGRAGDPRHPGPLGPRPAAGADPPGHGAARGRRTRAALEAVQPGLRARRPRPRPRARPRQPVARCAGDRADPADQPQRQPRPRARRLPAAGARAARPPDPVPSPRLAPARPAAGRLPLGPRRSSSRGSTTSPPAGTTSSAISPSCSARRPRAGPTPTRPSEKQVAGAAVDAITALLLENARMRRTEERLGAELAETQARPGALLPAADVPVPGEGRPPTAGRPAGPGDAAGLPRRRARNSSRSA